MRAGAWVLIVLGLAASLPHAEAASGPVVVASAYRLDLGEMAPGGVTNGTLSFTDVGDAAAEVALQFEGSPSYLSLSVTSFLLEPRESRDVAWTFIVPPDAAPGNHGEDVKVLVTPAGSGTSGAATLTAGSGIIVTERTVAVGVNAIEAPAQVLPSDTLQGRVLVVNTGPRSTTTGVRLTLANATTGEVAREARLPQQKVASNDSTAFPYAFAPDAAHPLARGAYELRAVVDAPDASGPPAALNVMKLAVLVGARGYALSFAKLEDLANGSVLVELKLVSTATVPMTAHPRVQFAPTGGGPPLSFDLTPVDLAPGESRVVTAFVDVPSAAYAVSATDDTRGGAPLTVDSGPASQLAVVARASAPAGVAWWPWLAIGVALAAGAGGAAVIRSRRRLASAPAAQAASTEGAVVVAPRAAPVVVAVAPAAPPPRGPTAQPRVVLLVDLCSLDAREPTLGGLVLQAEEAANAEGPIDHARAFYVGRSQEDVRERFLALKDAGLDATVSVSAKGAARNCHVTLSLEAQKHAERASTFIIATHDVAFAPLLLSLRAQGKRVVLVGRADELPVELISAADDVRPLAG